MRNVITAEAEGGNMVELSRILSFILFGFGTSLIPHKVVMFIKHFNHTTMFLCFCSGEYQPKKMWSIKFLKKHVRAYCTD